MAQRLHSLLAYCPGLAKDERSPMHRLSPLCLAVVDLAADLEVPLATGSVRRLLGHMAPP
jgi:hypothetical protein